MLREFMFLLVGPGKVAKISLASPQRVLINLDTKISEANRRETLVARQSEVINKVLGCGIVFTIRKWDVAEEFFWVNISSDSYVAWGAFSDVSLCGVILEVRGVWNHLRWPLNVEPNLEIRANKIKTKTKSHRKSGSLTDGKAFFLFYPKRWIRHFLGSVLESLLSQLQPAFTGHPQKSFSGSNLNTDFMIGL